MAQLTINAALCNRCGICITRCPFGALAMEAGEVTLNAGCKLCKLCIKQCPVGAITLEKTATEGINKLAWRGILVYVEHLDGVVHPVTLELIGKARELAGKIHQPVFALWIGAGIAERAAQLLQYGVDQVLVYDDEALRYFRADLYANLFEDGINELKPTAVLVGATSVGRSLAPRVAARFRTGLTADCTQLEIKPNTDLVQIRPAFGGNIMAQIVTTRTRPQFATVRYKVMEPATPVTAPTGTVLRREVSPKRLQSGLQVVEVIPKEKQENISDAEVLVVAGRGVKNRSDLALLQELADLLHGQLACTRPLVEAGWLSYTRQIGLSGRTVKPKLIITCGVSGAVQFTACMNSAEQIFAINLDRNAPIFKVAHYGIVGDLYQILPRLIAKIKEGGAATCHIIQ
ncbi:MAG TPA: electron transfer flavoprotein subunit alpha [Bacillota bacterium]